MTTTTTLPPEVATAVNRIGIYVDEKKLGENLDIIRAHLHRIAEENARLQKIEKDYGFAIDCERRRADGAEAELAALKARITEAPVVTVRDVYAIAAFPFSRIDAATMDRPVRLLVEDGERE